MEQQIAKADNTLIMRHMNFQAPFLENFFWTVLPATLALIAGAILNHFIEKWQGPSSSPPSKNRCATYFALQLAINAVILLLLARHVDAFVVWLQLTVSGIVSAVLFFVVQTSLSNNANCLI